MWCATRVNSWTLTISVLRKRPKSRIKHIRSQIVRRRYKLFYCHHQIKIPFETIKCELEKINQLFKANRLSLNVEKTNYSLFRETDKNSIKDKIPSKMPALKIGNKIIERTTSIKFLRVIKICFGKIRLKQLKIN